MYREQTACSIFALAKGVSPHMQTVSFQQIAKSEESEAKKDCEGANIDTPPKPLDHILLEVPEPLHNSLQLALDPRWYHRSRQPPCCLALFASNSLNQHPH